VLLLTPVENALTGTAPGASWRWAQSSDGLTLTRQGQSAPSELPPAAECVLVVPPARLAWHRVRLPKIAKARLRTLLEGLLEEHLLDEPAQLHFALEPGAQAGQADPCWVAICQRAWLDAQLQALEQAGRPAGRIVPAISPQPNGQLWLQAEAEQSWCLATSPAGVLALPLDCAAAVDPGSAAVLNQWLALHPVASDAPRPTASADAAHLALAERTWPTLDWSVATAPERWLQALRQGWNLAQFDLRLSASRGAGQWLPRAWRRLTRDPAWRPVRWSLAALLGLQLLGLNLLAWQAVRVERAQQRELRALLTQTFPQVKLVLDPPRQMQAELERLRQQQGALGGGDVERLLDALGRSGQGAAWQKIEFGPGQATLSGLPLDATEQQALQAALQASGWRVEPAGPDWRLSWERR
jgi:general secretion pathway protein L